MTAVVNFSTLLDKDVEFCMGELKSQSIATNLIVRREINSTLEDLSAGIHSLLVTPNFGKRKLKMVICEAFRQLETNLGMQSNLFTNACCTCANQMRLRMITHVGDIPEGQYKERNKVVQCVERESQRLTENLQEETQLLARMFQRNIRVTRNRIVDYVNSLVTISSVETTGCKLCVAETVRKLQDHYIEVYYHMIEKFGQYVDVVRESVYYEYVLNRDKEKF